MSDLIDRQDAIDAMNQIYCHVEMIRKRPVTKGEQALFLDMRETIKALPSAESEIVRCKDCKWGREVCGNIECFVDSNIPPEYHGYEWFCPNGENVKNEIHN